MPDSPRAVRPWLSYKERVSRLAQRIVDAQRPIRVLNAIKWDPSVFESFRDSGWRRLPSVTAEDYALIQKTMELDAGELLKISEEGKQSGLLHWKVAAICQTVATYAAGGWSRRPSVKQCRIVLEAVEKIRAEVV